ncbi:MAG: general secretion pathway protein GspK [Verrucomicrobia bacterium]|nr:general secretion pathway protein GspK [Verrucomicrobiota bacterium]
MRITLQPKPRGIALIIVMLMMVTFMMLAGGFAYSMKVETKLARNASMDAELEWLGRSGVERAKWILAQKCEPVDALNQIWAGGGGSLCESNGPLAGTSLKEEYELGRGRFSVKIVDLERKFNINTIRPDNRGPLEQALTLMNIDAAEGSRIVNAILDWMDPDDQTQIGSTDTESRYYLSLDPPHEAKNGPIDDLTELMRINGITPAMFYGSGGDVTYSRSMPRLPGLGHGTLEEPTYPIGFKDLFTTLSTGRLNINTANTDTLRLLHRDFPPPILDVDDMVANAVVSERAGLDGVEGTEDDMPYLSVDQVNRALMKVGRPELTPLFMQYGDVRSSTFEVHVTAQIDNYKREYVCILRREGGRLLSLFLYWK